MRYYVRYAKQPILFRIVGGKKVADVVPVSMATRFDGLNAAYERSCEQWGDNGLAHVDVTRDEPEAKPRMERGGQLDFNINQGTK